jgi:isopenicillin N synthase-like dioxygenase
LARTDRFRPRDPVICHARHIRVRTTLKNGISTDQASEAQASKNRENKKHVPVVDLKLAEENPELLKDMDLACKNHGFFLLKNHGIDAEINAMWKKSAAFFEQPSEVKRQIQRTETKPLGFYDRELTTRKRDLKEVFDFREVRTGKKDLNQWPRNDPEFQTVMSDFFAAAATIAARTLNIVYRALHANGEISNLPQGSTHTSNARLNFYPLGDPLDAQEQTSVASLGDMALHPHTDPGILTLLLQDLTGGLQTLTREGIWIDIEPEENTIVVNLGDMMQVWTNDIYKAAVHRVLPPAARTDAKNAAQARFSAPFFYSPEKDTVIRPLQLLSKTPPKYREFTWREYIQGRIDDNYADLGEDDIQIRQFYLDGAEARR